MKPVVYSMQFRGEVGRSAPGTLTATLSAPSSALVTTIDIDGLHGGFEAAPGNEASFRLRLSLSREPHGDQAGTIAFGAGHALHLRSADAVVLGPSPDAHLWHGTLVWHVASGEGQFAGASGRITSNIFLSDTGEVTDNQIGVIFVDRPQRPERLPREGAVTSTS